MSASHPSTSAFKILGFALVLGLLSAALGLWPHLRYGSSQGVEIAYFKSGFDEDTYASRISTGTVRMDRRFGAVAQNSLSRLLPGNLEKALVAEDFAIPLFVGFFAAILASVLTISWSLRTFICILLLFGQELLSTGSNIIWPNKWSFWKLARNSEGIAAKILPLFQTTFFSLFRSPDPQISFLVLFVFLLGVVWLVRGSDEGHVRPSKCGGGALILAGVLLPFTYIFVSLPLVITLFLLFLYFAWRRRLEMWVILGSGMFTFVCFLLALRAQEVGASGVTFASRLPALTPSVLVSLALLAISLLTIPRKVLFTSGVKCLGLALIAMPCILLNQQILTGMMVSVRDFEISVNYPLLVIGSSLCFLNNRRRMSPTFTWLIRSLTALGVVLVVSGQYKAYRAWFTHNETAHRYRTLLLKHNRDVQRKVVIADHPETAALVNLLSPKPFRIIAYFNDLQDDPVSPVSTETQPLKLSSHAYEAFSAFFIVGLSTVQVEELLRAELEEKRSYYYLGFFFSFRDSSFVHTDRRAYRHRWVESQIPTVVEAYKKFLLSQQEPLAPTLILTQQIEPERSAFGKNELLGSISADKAFPWPTYLYLHRSSSRERP